MSGIEAAGRGDPLMAETAVESRTGDVREGFASGHLQTAD